MSSRSNKLFALVILLVFTVFVMPLAGCGSKQTANTLRWATGDEPSTLDPRKSPGTPEARILFQMFEGLCTENQKGEIVPGVAEKWEISQDGLHYTFFLRKDAKWSNGEPVTARDFEYTWKSALDPEFGSKIVEMLYYIKNAEKYNKGEAGADTVGVKALDDYTLQVDLESPTAYFLSLTALSSKYLPVSQKTVANNPKWVEDTANFVSNGPFKMVSWKHGSKIELVKNENYWNKSIVKLEKIDCVLTDNNVTTLSMFNSGQLDVSDAGYPQAEAKKLLDEGKLKMFPILYLYYYSLMPNVKPLENLNVRKALAYSIDREAIVNKSGVGGSKAAYAVVSNGITDPATGKDFRDEGGNYLKFDVAEAQKLLAEAGFPNGQGFPSLKLLYNNSEMHKAIAEMVQEMWRKNLNVNVELVNQEWKTYEQAMRDGHYEIGRSGWQGDYLDPMTYLDIFRTGDSNNRPKYSSAAYDALIAKAKTTVDVAERMKILHEAEDVLMKDVPIVPVYFGSGKTLQTPKVKGIIRDATDLVIMREAYIAD